MGELTLKLSLLFNRLVNGKVKGHEDVHISRLPEEEQHKAYRTAWALSWPAGVEGLLYGLTSFIDLAVVSLLGTAGMNAVSIAYQPRTLLVCIVFSLNVGILAVAARYRGENNRDAANRCLKEALVLSAVISAIPLGLAYIFMRPFMLISGALPDFLDLAVQYFRHSIPGLYLYCLSTTICAVQRGVGNSRVSLVSNLVGNAVRVIASYALIRGLPGLPPMGILGAAAGSNIGYIVTILIALQSILTKKSYVYLGYRSPDNQEDRKRMNSLIFRIGSSGLAEQLSYRVGMLIFVRLISILGMAEFNSYVICNGFMGVAYEICAKFGEASAALSGQAIGARRKDMAIVYTDIVQKFGFAVSLLFAFACIFLKYPLINIYTKDPEVIELTARLMYICAFICLLQSVQLIVAGTLRGAGDTRYVAVWTLIITAFLRPLATYFLIYSAGMGVYGAWAAMIMDQGLRYLLFRRRFIHGRWMEVI